MAEARAGAGATSGDKAGGIILPFALVTLIWSSTWIVIRDQLLSLIHISEPTRPY